MPRREPACDRLLHARQDGKSPIDHWLEAGAPLFSQAAGVLSHIDERAYRAASVRKRTIERRWRRLANAPSRSRLGRVRTNLSTES